MRNQWKKVIAVLLACMLFPFEVFSLPVMAKTTVQKPVVITNTITDATTSIQVYGEKNAVLYVKNGKKVIAKKTYSSESVKTISIKAQKAGSTLEFYLSKSGKKGLSVKKRVDKIAAQGRSKSIKSPVVSTKSIKATTTKIKVKGYKNTKLYIKNDSNKTVKSVTYTKNAVKTITIPKQTATTALYFYAVKGNKRSAVVRKAVKDNAAPAKPTVKEKSSSTIVVKGELGSAVYVKYGTKASYTKKGFITSKNGKTISGLKPDSNGYYQVKLKDISGNTSSVKKIKSKYFKKKEETKDPVYTYEITPLLPPFNSYFYVKTNNPDPASFRFVDKSSVYYGKDDAPAVIEAVDTRFMDVTYEKKSVGRVKGGYIFVSDGAVDGGKLTLQTKAASGYKDTKKTVSCPKVKGSVQYLIDTYTSSKKSFFENMDAVQKGLDELALYPRRTKDVNKKNKYWPYPFLAVSPYPELSLNDHYEMYETAEEPLLLNSLYPYILDSLGFPSTMALVAKRLDSSCKVQWGDYHYLVEVTKGKETRYYGGAGSGDSDPLYSNRVEKLFRFDGSSKDYAKGTSIRTLAEKRNAYGELAKQDAESYRDMLEGSTFSKKIGVGQWIRVAREGANASSKSYAYVTHGCVYEPGSGNRAYSVENAWVDGRYMDQYNKFVPGEKFSQHPKADIIIRDMTYTNMWGQIRRGDVTFEYDESSGCWIAWAYAAYSSSSWQTVSIEELPDEMILTPKEVAELKVDRNADKIPSGLIYDGSVKPGTPYTAK
ncbi:MAG: hypothetical protein HFI76_03960 [Lachnospiraceae bacterium]|nr:hypothetical protein [Lachnospiraceae bacterium]